MFRKLLLSAAAGLALLSPLAAAAPAAAHEFHREPRRERRDEETCRVFYRDSCRAGWTCAGAFRDSREAERCAEQYRCRGLEVSVR